MPPTTRRLGVPEWLIVVGAGVFLFGLTVSAVFVPELRWLHLIQGSIYVAAIALSVRRSRWGYFVGISAGAFWNYLIMFASPLIATLLAQLSGWIHGGGAPRADLILQGGAWLGNGLLIAGALWGYLRLPKRGRADIVRLVATFIVANGYLIAAVAAFTPDRLSLIAQGLHPHWP